MECTVLDAIESQHEGTEKGVFLRGVRDATGFGSSRTADGLYMGCWQSVGVQLHGFEVKVSRGDWLREIQDVSKAGCFEKFCQYWWIAVPDGIVELAEMPAQWGLKVVSKNENGSYSVRVKKAATINPNASLDYRFFASCLRQCKREDPIAAEIEQIRQSAYKAGEEFGRSQNRTQWELDRERGEIDKLRKKVKEFEEASGVHIFDGWNRHQKIGKAVQHVLDHGTCPHDRLQMIIDHCDRVKLDLQQLIEESKQTDPPAPRESVDENSEASYPTLAD
jgi:hypothetical protein